MNALFAAVLVAWAAVAFGPTLRQRYREWRGD